MLKGDNNTSMMRGATNKTDVANKKVYVYFHHYGVLAIGPKKNEIEEFLLKVWNQFGPVTDVIYRKEFRYAIIQFRTHNHAIFAYCGLKDPIQVQVAVHNATECDANRTALAKELFIEEDGRLIVPVWDGPRLDTPKKRKKNVNKPDILVRPVPYSKGITTFK